MGTVEDIPGGHHRALGRVEVGRVIVARSAVAVVVRDGEILVVKQRRQNRDGGGGGVSLELPGGKIEPGEQPVAAAVRELYEETGLSAEGARLQFCLDMDRPGWEYRVDVVVVDAARPGGPGALTALWLPLGEAVRRIDAGEITHAVTAAAILRAALAQHGPAAPPAVSSAVSCAAPPVPPGPRRPSCPGPADGR